MPEDSIPNYTDALVKTTNVSSDEVASLEETPKIADISPANEVFDKSYVRDSIITNSEENPYKIKRPYKIELKATIKK